MTAWHDLEHAYGPADDLPALLQALTPDPEAGVWGDVWSRICHQGTVYSASFPALPILQALAASWPAAQRSMPLCLAGCIVIGAHAQGQAAALEALGGTVAQLQALAADTLASGLLNENDHVYMLEAALALRGDPLWGNTLGRLLEGEFSGICPACDTELYLAIGEYGCFATSEDWSNRPEVARTPILPADVATLDGTGQWLYAQSRQHPQIANWLLHLFGHTSCPDCGADIAVPAAIAAA
ncbi:hypothetical protein SAMN02745857_03599 [Andreprevotia lacus DSM 23236]|jgi:hypothetical protein|uniref:Uncharacterized protein n=1 Tax=Andreprevotia lacus DSM 23236 TaxID=1121001 RepID=A0A1W1XZ12_9NEIS|nr:hypothetical protein [Andreprevotia lacus]SMC29097.1 hypothetical protein SAMN02745857_03599 [Andreprevotia lacus DSM 23236]